MAIIRKTAAALCAAVLTLTALPAVRSAALDLEPQTPDWVPTDVSGTVAFLNEYGRTHTEGGFICFVIKQGKDMNYWFTADPAFYTVSVQNIVPEIPEEPGFLTVNMTAEEREEYRKKERAYEEYQQFIQMCGEEAFADLPTYQVVTLMPQETGEHAVSVACSPKDDLLEESTGGEPIHIATYTFNFAPDGSITETDELSWRPDSPSEFSAFTEENGTLSMRDEKVIVAVTTNPSTGAELIIGQNGTPYNLAADYHIPTHREYPIPLAGEGTRVLKIYTPREEGFTYFTIFNGQPWAAEYAEVKLAKGITAESQADGTYTVKPGPMILWDLNADGRRTLADVVLLSRFLIADADFNEAQLLMADVNGDSKVNAKDLSALKAQIFSEIVFIDDPIASTEK